MRFVDHRVACLSGEHGAQHLAFGIGRHPLQAAIGAAEVVGYRTAGTHGNPGIALQLLQFDAAAAIALPHHQPGNPQVGIGEQPQAQPGWGLAEAGSDIHAPSAQGIVERRLVGIALPPQGHLHCRGQPAHQLHVGPGILLQAAVVLGIGRFGDHPDAQFPMLRQPGP
ncbi:Uncharacterised protein [Enterobacter cloacae]|nr:Uncharacterised protein [Enterobacter cloacae]